jgi:hypothetical protein
MANGTRIIQATYTALRSLPQLPLAARRAHIFAGLRNCALFSIGQLCDRGFEALVTANHVTLRRDSTIWLIRDREHRNFLWNINLSTPPPTAKMSTKSLLPNDPANMPTTLTESEPRRPSQRFAPRFHQEPCQVHVNQSHKRRLFSNLSRSNIFSLHETSKKIGRNGQ